MHSTGLLPQSGAVCRDDVFWYIRYCIVKLGGEGGVIGMLDPMILLAGIMENSSDR